MNLHQEGLGDKETDYIPHSIAKYWDQWLTSHQLIKASPFSEAWSLQAGDFTDFVATPTKAIFVLLTAIYRNEISRYIYVICNH